MKSPRFAFAFIGLAAAALLAGCGTVEIPGLKDVLSGADYLSSLHAAGKLPGVETNTSPHFTAMPISLSSFGASNQFQSLKFWLTVPEKTNTVFWYQITRNDRQEPWTLNYAVQADTNGQNSVDLLKAPVPDSKEIELEAKSKSQ
jgi:hypothetical protein